MKNSALTKFIFFLALVLPAVVALLAVVISYNLNKAHLIDPLKKTGLLFLLGSTVVAYFLSRKAIRMEGKSNPEQEKKAVLILVILGGLFYGLVGYNAHKACSKFATCELIVDNGADAAITVKINGDAKTVSAHSMTSVNVPTGTVTTEFNGDLKSHEVTFGQWIFNPGMKNAYYITTSSYSIGGGFASDDVPSDEDLGNPEFFQVTANYLFDTPSTVSSSNLIGGERRTTLKRK